MFFFFFFFWGGGGGGGGGGGHSVLRTLFIAKINFVVSVTILAAFSCIFLHITLLLGTDVPYCVGIFKYKS